MTARVGILGTGWGVRVQLPVFRYAGLEVTAMWARSEEKARRLAAEHGLALVTTDTAELLEHTGLDLVSIVTPPHTHRELATAALYAGLDVLCEKPTALDAGEAEAMVGAAAAQPERLALIDHELRFLPRLRWMRELVQSGWVGEPSFAEASFSGHGRLGSGWRFDWWSRRDRGGGVLGAAGSHLLDMLHFLTGRRVERVRADLANGLSLRPDADGVERRVTSDDHASLLLRLEGDLPARLQATSLAAGPPALEFVLAGDEGRLAYRGRRLLGWRSGAREAEELDPEIEKWPVAGVRDNEWGRGTLALARALARSYQSGDRSPLATAATFADGLAVQRALDAARASAEEGIWRQV